MAEGREGDWECNGCRNRNYAFRSFCNRCKQPRLLVDNKTPPDSKWLPRIGDWICSGCTNNNYASRDKCKKCGQPKEVAAMPVAIPGASLPTYAPYFARGQGGPDPKMSYGFVSNTTLQQPLPLGSGYGAQPAAASWSLGVNNAPAGSYGNPANQYVMVPEGWRTGDWICNCGFHNYSSRAQCKKCNASVPPALGTKRLASQEFGGDWDNKRLNAGYTNGVQQPYPGFDQMPGLSGNQRPGMYVPYPGGTSAAPNYQMPMQLPQLATTPAILGKGAKQWRDGDWMCTGCSNHNFASRSQCNRCQTERDAPAPTPTLTPAAAAAAAVAAAAAAAAAAPAPAAPVTVT